MKNMIPHNNPSMGPEEEMAALKVIRSAWLAQGKEVECFETEFSHFFGLPSNHSVAVSSGTAALFLSLWVLSAKQKKVAFPVYSCSALRNAVSLIGGFEIIIDTLPGNPNINLKHLHKCKPDIAIIPHMYGVPSVISQTKDLLIIEDCAQSIGAKVGSLPAGLQGHIGIFSFYATKLLTSGGQGGMVISKDSSLIDAIRDYRQFDCRQDKKKRFNFQMTDIQAAIGRVQLKKLEGFLSKREEIFQQYQQAGLNMLDIIDKTQNIVPVRYRAILLTKNQKKIIQYLYSKNIRCIIPVKDWELLGRPEVYSNAFKLTQETVSLPIYPSLSKNQMHHIVEELKKVIYCKG